MRVRVLRLAGLLVCALVATILQPAQTQEKQIVQEFKEKVKLGEHSVKFDADKLYLISLRTNQFRPSFAIVDGDKVVARGNVLPGSGEPEAFASFSTTRAAAYRIVIVPIPRDKIGEAGLDYTLKVAEAKRELFVKDQLTKDDPVYAPRKTWHKVHTVKLQADKTYQIDLKSQAFDAYLFLEDSDQKILAQDDDSGGDLDARIFFRPTRTDTYRVIATSYAPNTEGPYTLGVIENPSVFLPRKISQGDRNDPAVTQLAKEVRDKGWIVYSARSDKGDWDLFLCRPDGSDIRNITHTPDYNEAYPLFSRDGQKLLYRRLPKNEQIEGINYGAQGQLVIANSDGSDPVVFGQPGEYPFASWSPDGKQIACLTKKGIQFVDLATKEVVKTIPRQGFFAQLTWSPDGKSFSGTANNLGAGAWGVARLDIASGEVIPVSKVNSCTPDWFPDSKSFVHSKRPKQWTQLWANDAQGKSPRLLYAEDGRHVYGGHISPDGKYALFTGNMQETGDTGHAGSPMGLMRLADAPILGGDISKLKDTVPQFNTGPVLVLPWAWEPCWTSSEAPVRRRAASNKQQVIGVRLRACSN